MLQVPSRTIPQSHEVISAGGPSATKATPSKRTSIVSLTAAVLLGLFVRAAFVFASEFPLNDGGLFYVMVEDLQHAGFALPHYTSYNSAEIPFAYPPLPFYLAALLQTLTHLPLIEIFRVLPLAASVLTVLAFYLLSRAMVPFKSATVVAVFAFALLPRSFNWEITGGGLTRAPGFLLALLAIQHGYLLYVHGRRWSLLLTTLLAALAVLSHLEMGGVVVFTLGILFFAHGRNRTGIRNSALIGLGVLALTSPWWATVLSRHGLAPFLAAAQTGGHSWNGWLGPLLVHFTDEPFYGLLAVLALLGACVCLAERKFFLPVWLAAIFILDPRKAPTYAAAPAAMLAGIAVTELILPRLNRRSSHTATTGPQRKATGEGMAPALSVRPSLSGLVLAAGLVYLTLSALIPPPTWPSPLHSLTREQIDAMRWVATHTSDDSRFLVFASDRLTAPRWATDRASEWFPALAERSSVLTVQGYEWLGKARYTAQTEAYRAFQLCAESDVHCLEEQAATWAITFTHVYLPKAPPHSSRFSDCCAALRVSLLSSVNYQVVYDGPGATIFARRPTPQILHDTAAGYLETTLPD